MAYPVDPLKSPPLTAQQVMAQKIQFFKDLPEDVMNHVDRQKMLNEIIKQSITPQHMVQQSPMPQTLTFNIPMRLPFTASTHMHQCFDELVKNAISEFRFEVYEPNGPATQVVMSNKNAFEAMRVQHRAGRRPEDLFADFCLLAANAYSTARRSTTLPPGHPYKDPKYPPLKPRQWENDMPELNDPQTQRLSPVGMIYQRLNAAPADYMRWNGAVLPHIAHISCHIVQARVQPAHPDKVIVFVVTDQGEDITLYDDHPHLFPSDNLILKLRMITDKE